MDFKHHFPSSMMWVSYQSGLIMRLKLILLINMFISHDIIICNAIYITYHLISQHHSNQYHPIIKQTTLSKYYSNTHLHIYLNLNNCISLNKPIYHCIKELGIILSEWNTHSYSFLQKSVNRNINCNII